MTSMDSIKSTWKHSVKGTTVYAVQTIVMDGG